MQHLKLFFFCPPSSLCQRTQNMHMRNTPVAKVLKEKYRIDWDNHWSGWPLLKAILLPVWCQVTEVQLKLTQYISSCRWRNKKQTNKSQNPTNMCKYLTRISVNGSNYGYAVYFYMAPKSWSFKIQKWFTWKNTAYFVLPDNSKNGVKFKIQGVTPFNP